MDLGPNLGAHRAGLGKRNSCRPGPCHLNLSGKHFAADLNGMEKKYDLHTAWPLEDLATGGGEREYCTTHN